MHNIVELLQNQALWCAVAAWFIAQALKIPTYWLVEKKLDLMRFFEPLRFLPGGDGAEAHEHQSVCSAEEAPVACGGSGCHRDVRCLGCPP